MKNQTYEFVRMEWSSGDNMITLEHRVNSVVKDLQQEGYKVNLLSTLRGEEGYIQTFEVLRPINPKAK